MPEGFYISHDGENVEVGPWDPDFEIRNQVVTDMEIPDAIINAGRIVFKAQQMIAVHQADIKTLLSNPQFDRS